MSNSENLEKKVDATVEQKAEKKATAKKASAKKAEVKKASAKTDAKAEVKTEEKKAEKKTIEHRVNNVIRQLKTTERIQFETAETAVNANNSATVTQKNAIMLTLVSADSKSAKRVVEIWVHSKRVDVCISKKVFQSLCSADSASAKAITAYQKFIDAKAKSSKNVFKLADDATAVKFVNLVTESL